MPDTEINLFKWAIEQGGILMLCLVIGYFYRRDFQSRDADRKADLGILVNALDNSRKVNEDLLARHASQTEKVITLMTQVSTVLSEQATLIKALLYETKESRTEARRHAAHSGNS